jgi:hypothetical protein
MIEKIVSGGQTGADQAGLDVAIHFGLDYGGYLPRGRRTERGSLPFRYKNMIETDSRDYPTRTILNITNSDGTVVLTFGSPTGGSAFTLRKCLEKFKPSLHVSLRYITDTVLIGTDNSRSRDVICKWLTENEINNLNVAGSRLSKFPDIYERVYSILEMVIYRQRNKCGVYDCDRKKESAYMNPFVEV